MCLAIYLSKEIFEIVQIFRRSLMNFWFQMSILVMFSICTYLVYINKWILLINNLIDRRAPSWIEIWLDIWQLLLLRICIAIYWLSSMAGKMDLWRSRTRIYISHLNSTLCKKKKRFFLVDSTQILVSKHYCSLFDFELNNKIRLCFIIYRVKLELTWGNNLN